jgi:hypothetical protein
VQRDHHWYIIDVFASFVHAHSSYTISQRNITQLDMKQGDTIRRVRGTEPPGTPLLDGKVRPMNCMFSDSLTGSTSRNVHNTRPEKL